MMLAAQEGEPGLLDNEILDEYQLPVAEWAEQLVDWMVRELR